MLSGPGEDAKIALADTCGLLGDRFAEGASGDGGASEGVDWKELRTFGRALEECALQEREKLTLARMGNRPAPVYANYSAGRPPPSVARLARRSKVPGSSPRCPVVALHVRGQDAVVVGALPRFTAQTPWLGPAPKEQVPVCGG